MAHELPALPYAHDTLEPHIDSRTMEIHHGKHHAAYVANLNKALEGNDELAQRSIIELLSDLTSVPESSRGAVRNRSPTRPVKPTASKNAVSKSGFSLAAVNGSAISRIWGASSQILKNLTWAGSLVSRCFSIKP